MKKANKERLERAGWTVGNAGDFLGLSPEEEYLVEIRLALGDEVRASRKRANLTQMALAKRIGSSQSRVAKIETGDPTVSIDLQMRALLAAGSRPRAVFSVLARKVAERTRSRRHCRRSRRMRGNRSRWPRSRVASRRGIQDFHRLELSAAETRSGMGNPSESADTSSSARGQGARRLKAGRRATGLLSPSFC